MTNDKIMDFYDCTRCEGVPFLYLPESMEYLCGEITKEELEEKINLSS